MDQAEICYFFLADAVINSMLNTQYRSGGVYFSLVLRMTHLALLKNLADIILFAKSDERLCSKPLNGHCLGVFYAND